MNKSLSNIVIFVVGFLACAVILAILYGTKLGALLPGSAARSQQAVLASLSVPPGPTRHFTGDSVVADAAAKLEPAIVDVHTVGKAIQESAGPFGDDPVFRQFFGGGVQTIVPKGAGSGVIISPDGYILTNDHVVENTQTVTVKVGDKGYTARVIGTDPVSDIAVVKIDTKGVRLPTAELGNSDNIRVGDWAIAIGNPLDIGTTVTLGIISALNRSGLVAEGHNINSVIQTDAAINPGNSGGALANIDGQVIGINEAIASPTGSYVGIGFAIPINVAKKIAIQLIKNGRIIRPYVGVSYAPLKFYPAQARQQMGITITQDEGVVVQQVFPGSPADKAGLKVYDVILEANRQKVNDADTLTNMTAKMKVGDTIALLISRGGHNQIVTVKLAERPASFDQIRQQPQEEENPMQQMPDQP